TPHQVRGRLSSNEEKFWLPRTPGFEERGAVSPNGAAGRLIRGASLFVGVFCLFSLVTVLFLWPCISHLHTALIGPPEDNMNDFWDTWYAIMARNPAHFFQTDLLRFPEGTSLVYQSFAWPQVFAVVVLSRVFGTNMGTLVALQNVTLLGSFPLAGVGAFYLVRHFVQSTFGSLIGGFVFAFNPSHVAQAMHHAGVSSIEFLPFFALAYLVALERRSAIWIAVAAAFYALSALSCWYYLFYGAYFMGFHLLYARVREGAWPSGWQLAAPALCILCTVAVLSPLIVPMALAARQSIYEPGGNIFVADLLAYIVFPPEHLLSGLSRGFYARLPGHPWEATVYLGLVNLAVLGWQCRRTGLSRTSPMFYVLFGMVFFGILACGESLHIAGISTHLPLPDAGLDRLPFFANVRTPSRAIVFVYLFMSIGIGFAIASLLQRRQFAATVGAAALAALMVVDFYPANLAATHVTRPPGLRVLQLDPDRGFGVLDLPWGYAEEDAYMLEQVYHRRPIVDGMTTRNMGNTLLDRLSLTDLSKQREQLAHAHVKYILLHRPKNGFYGWNKELAPRAQFLKTYRAVYDGPDMTVLRVY
ncbi:MAG: hypothetical protein ACREHV_15225, partial [Rhizomicrobium sp.]